MPKTLYLDHADLVYIADNKATKVDALRDALRVTGARLLVSMAHIYDQANADEASRERWASAVTQLAPESDAWVVRDAHG